MVKKPPRNFVVGWLKGFLDGEGCITTQHSSKMNRGYPRIAVEQVDQATICKYKEYLEELGFSPTEIKPTQRMGRQEINRVYLNKATDIIRFHRLLGFTDPRKQFKLDRWAEELYKRGNK